jgi:hypothetical protein
VHGGQDPRDSGFIFHFHNLGQIQDARDELLANHLWAFGTTQQMEALGLVHREAAAETMVISRITAQTMDNADAGFFYL